MNRISLLVGCFGFLAVACSGSVGGACDPEKKDDDQTCEKDCDPSTDTAGAACSREGQVCYYGDADCLYTGVCKDGVWVGSTECTGGAGGGGGGGGAGGSIGCTEIGCEDGFTLTLEAGNGTFTPGEYTINTDIDGVTDTCAITIGAMVDSTCNALINLQSMPNQIDILFGGTPMSVGVVVSLDGMEIHNETYTPMYMEVQPNGPGCPPICQEAGAVVTL